jgi:AcrR family transcriptional regulator
VTTITRRRRPLTRRRILQTALRLVERTGLESLSMRRIGDALGVEAMSLYKHVANKSALLDGLVELLLGELEIPGPEVGDWMVRVRHLCRSYRRVAHAHPHAFPLVVTRSYNTPATLAQVEAALQILHEAGFDAEVALHAFQTWSSYVSGYVLAELPRLTRHPQGGAAAAHLDRRQLDPDAFPRLVALGPYYAARDRDSEFEYGLEVVLCGLQARLSRPVAERSDPTARIP